MTTRSTYISLNLKIIEQARRQEEVVIEVFEMFFSIISPFMGIVNT